MQSTIGYFEINGEVRGRQDVFFTGIQMQAKESRFTGSWTTTLMEHNEETMVHPVPCTACFVFHQAYLRAVARHCLRHSFGWPRWPCATARILIDTATFVAEWSSASSLLPRRL